MSELRANEEKLDIMEAILRIMVNVPDDVRQSLGEYIFNSFQDCNETIIAAQIRFGCNVLNPKVLEELKNSYENTVLMADILRVMYAALNTSLFIDRRE